MLNRIITLSILLLFIISLPTLHSQTTITAAGGNATGTGGSASYSVGQVVYTMASGSQGSILQGVQQPYEISVVTGIEEENINLSFSVYPNPATDFLSLKIDNYDTEKLSYRLYDIRGNLLQNQNILAADTMIPMQNISKGAYILKIIFGVKELKTFKIIKN